MEEKETRVAVIGIIVEKPESVEELNHTLSEYRDYIIGRIDGVSSKAAFSNV